MGVLGVLLEGAFDEAAHPRGPHGRWIRALNALDPSSRDFTDVGGVAVRRGGIGGRLFITKRYLGVNRTPHETHHGSAEEAARFIEQAQPSADRHGGFDPVTMLGREGTAARERGANSSASEHADTRDKLTNLPVGQTYGLHGPRGQVGRVDRTAKGFEVYGPHAAEPQVHKSPSSAAGHAMRIQRSAAQSPRHADVAKRNYAHHQEVARMNARQSQRAEAEAARQRQITSRRRSAARDALGVPRMRAQESVISPLDALLEGFAAQQEEPFPDHPFTTGDQVRVAAGNGGKSIVGRVMRPHGGPPATHAVISPEGGGAHVLAPVGQVKLNTPAQHAAMARRREQQAAKQEQDKAHAAWMAAKPGGKPSGMMREGVSVLLEAFASPAAPKETPAQSAAIGAQQVAAAQKSLAAGWNASKHPRGQGGKFGYTTGGRSRSKRGTRSSAASSRTLGVGSSGSLVRSIQRQLGISADGKYGPLTRAAVTRYQQQHGLQVDGVVGRQTLAALRGHANPRLVTPGPIAARAAAVLTHPTQRKAKVKVPAPVRIGGGQVV